MSGQEKSLFLKKDGWIRWLFWGMAIVLIVLGAFAVVKIMEKTSVSGVPANYTFVVVDDAEAASGLTVTYYVYSNKVIADTERNIEGRSLKGSILVYDEVDTSTVVYEGEDATEACVVSACKDKKKALREVKKIIANSVGREYIGR